MFAFVRGILDYASPLYVVLEANSLGYKIFIPASSFSKLPSLGESLQLYTTLVIRENSHALYGFLTTPERELFEELIAVSGIGPKTALNLLAHLSPVELQQAVAVKDLSRICKVPGIGKKTAERLLIEMRDKFSSLGLFSAGDWENAPSANDEAQNVRDALSALVNLGYNQSIAQKALKKTLKDLPSDTDLATLLSAALKNI